MEPLDASDPRTIGTFTVQGLLGAGGMGRVYLAVDPAGEQVAVKVIRPELSDDPDFRARFRREVVAAGRVPGTVTAAVVATDTDAARPWVATRYLMGPSLAERVIDGGPLAGRELTTLARGLLRALAAVHEAGLVHRDLKPSNVILAPDGPRIIDFGIARAADSTRLTITGHVLGTPGFMSPEQALGGSDLGPPCDVFALGSVLVFAATGRSPFAAPSTPAVLFRILHQDPDLGDTPDPVRGIALRCLAREPVARPAVPALLADLRPRWVWRSALAVAAAAVLAVVVLLGAQLLAPGARVETPVQGGPLIPTPPPAVAAAPDPDSPAATVAATVPLGHRVGRVVAGADRVYVSDVDTGAISVLDTAGTRVGRVDVGRFPSALALGRDRLFVALNTSPSRIVAVDRATLEVVGNVAIGVATADPAGLIDVSLALSPDGATLFVLDPRSSRIAALDTATLQTREAPAGSGKPWAMTVHPDGKRIYVTAAHEDYGLGTITVFDAATLEVVTTLPGSWSPAAIAAGPDGRRLFLANGDGDPDPSANTVWVLDTTNGAVVLRLTSLLSQFRLIAGTKWLYTADADKITAVDLDTSSIRAEMTPPHRVNDIAIAPDRRTLYAVGDSSLTLLRSPA